MDLNEVYSPGNSPKACQLSGKHMQFFQEISDPRECAKTVGHKLFGTAAIWV
jgi:hypothetical protein